MGEGEEGVGGYRKGGGEAVEIYKPMLGFLQCDTRTGKQIDNLRGSTWRL